MARLHCQYLICGKRKGCFDDSLSVCVCESFVVENVSCSIDGEDGDSRRPDEIQGSEKDFCKALLLNSSLRDGFILACSLTCKSMCSARWSGLARLIRGPICPEHCLLGKNTGAYKALRLWENRDWASGSDITALCLTILSSPKVNSSCSKHDHLASRLDPIFPSSRSSN